MIKKIFKYTGRIVWGMFTALFGLATYFELTPVGDGPCEAGQKGPDPLSAFVCALVSLLLFCFVWYSTNGNWDEEWVREPSLDPGEREIVINA